MLQYDQSELDWLEQRLGRLHARQRTGVERDHEEHVFRRDSTFFSVDGWKLVARAAEYTLKMGGLFGRARRNATCIAVRHNTVRSPELPPAFDGFTILHLSDLHCDTSLAAIRQLETVLPELSYDICVLTGDYRGATHGSFGAALALMADLRPKIISPVYGVLGDHDPTGMLPHLESMNIRMLMNEYEEITRQGKKIYLAGIDDAHFYRVDNIEKVASAIPREEYSILLSHTPEIYRQAAHCEFNLLLSGHTHGGQICLPGGIPITLAANLPRRLGAGPWLHRQLSGYTSVGAGTVGVPVRLNCAPEITLHRLQYSGCASSGGEACKAVTYHAAERQNRG